MNETILKMKVKKTTTKVELQGKAKGVLINRSETTETEIEITERKERCKKIKSPR